MDTLSKGDGRPHAGRLRDPPLSKWGESSCLRAFKLEHQLFLAFGLKLQRALWPSLEPA